MADNSKYKFGFDIYHDNRIPKWSDLIAWDKGVSFMYFRLGVGVIEDDLSKLLQAASQTAWDLGGYYELWTPLLPKDRMLQTLKDQLPKVRDVLTLPVALVFEPETDVDRKGNKTTSWPSVGDLKYLATAVANMGYKVLVYANLSGLDIIKASGLIDMANTDWWISRYYFFPFWSVEMSVDSTLDLLKTKYGIPKERVQFMQTVGDHGSYPDGTSGADYDRAVSWSFDEPAPVPPPPPQPEDKHVIELVGRDGVSESVTFAKNLRGPSANVQRVNFDTYPFYAPGFQPAPEPPPPPVVNEVKYGILRYQKIENELTTTGRYTPAVVQLQNRPIPDGRKGDPIPVRPSAWDYIDKTNDDKGRRYARSIGDMWINSTYTDPLQAKAESISVQFNFVSWTDERNGCKKLRCFPNNQDFSIFDPLKVNWRTRPDVFFKAVAINIDGNRTKVGNAIDCFLPLMARVVNNNGLPDGTGELWLASDEIEEFPALPQTVTIQVDKLNIRDLPGTENKDIGDYLAGESVVLLEYRPLGASVWGRTEKGWICLLLADLPGQHQFMTTWKIETPGVVV